MADGEIVFKTKIDESGVDKGLKGLAQKLKSIGTSKTTSSIANIGIAIGGIGTAAKAAIGVVKSIKATIDDLTETYKVQAQAETQLETAAKNNPYLLSSSVRELKRYASELQSISTYGDEQLLPMMAQLASSGRTQTEIMDIMSASMDVAASGVMSLESATKYLNSSFSGLTGELGERIPQVKTLTSEELKQGKAVELVANQYKGMAREVAKATGTSQQLKNAVGDLKEELGAPFEKALSPVRAFFTELIGGWAEAIKKSREYKESEKRVENHEGTLTDYDRKVKEVEARILGAREEIEAIERTIADGAATSETYQNLEKAKRVIAQLTNEYALYVRKREELANAEKEANDRAIAEQRAAETRAQLEAEQEARDKLRAAYDETLRQKQEEINQRRINGEEISAEAEAQEMYNTAFSAYVKMMSDPAFKGNGGNHEHETGARAQIAEWGKIASGDELKKQIADFENELQRAADEAAGIVQNHYDALLDTLDAEYNAVIENKYLEEKEKLRIEKEYADKRAGIVQARNDAEKAGLREKLDALTDGNESYWKQYKAKIEELAKLEKDVEASTVLDHDEKEAAKTEITRTAVESRKQLIASVAADVATYTSQAVSIMQDAANLMLETVQYQTDAELAELELKYRRGEMGEEEYNEKVTEAKKKAAKEQYKIQMFQWSASILQATANIAEGVTKAIAQGGMMGLITGGLVAASGAVQIASIVASKPTPPSFAGGGIVPGNSYSGDRVRANVNSGEMILNAAQQRSLWDMANGRGAGGGANVVVNNSASNVVRAQPQITKDKIEILIDARVNEGLKNGRYDQSLAMANQGMDGDNWGI